MSSPSVVNAATRDDLSSAIGPDKLERLTNRFTTMLAGALAGDERPADDVGREAHTLVSMAGMLGCDALSEACRVLEQAAKHGGDLTVPLHEARRLRDATLAELSAPRLEPSVPQ